MSDTISTSTKANKDFYYREQGGYIYQSRSFNNIILDGKLKKIHYKTVTYENSRKILGKFLVIFVRFSFVKVLNSHLIQHHSFSIALTF